MTLSIYFIKTHSYRFHTLWRLIHCHLVYWWGDFPVFFITMYLYTSCREFLQKLKVFRYINPSITNCCFIASAIHQGVKVKVLFIIQFLNPFFNITPFLFSISLFNVECQTRELLVPFLWQSLTGDWTWDLPHSKPALYH